MKSGKSTVGSPPLKFIGGQNYKKYEDCVKSLLKQGRDVGLCVSTTEEILDQDGKGTGNFAYSHNNAPRLNKLQKPIYMRQHSSPDACGGYIRNVPHANADPYMGVGYSYNEDNQNCYVTSEIEDITEDNLWPPPPPPPPPPCKSCPPAQKPCPPSPPPSKSSSHVGLILGITIPIIIIIIALVAYFLLFKK
jgi:hypothetical protein